MDGVDAAHRRMESLFIESNPEPPRSQSLHRINEPPARPDDLSRSYYHIAGNARRPSNPTNHSNPLSLATEGRSWRTELTHESNIGSIRLSDTESYL